MIEAWGRGYERILEACSENGTPAPEAELEPSGLGLTFHFLPEHQAKQSTSSQRETSSENIRKATPQDAAATTQEAGQATQEAPETTQETDQATQEAPRTTQEKVLALLQAEPEITRRQIAEQIGITPDGVKYHLDKLRRGGSIRHVGPRKAGRWEVLK